MKVKGVFFVLSLVLLISCGKDTIVPEPTPIVPGSSDLKSIQFSVGTISDGRAEEMNNSNFIVDGRRLGVFAYKHSGELVNGVDITNVRNFPLTYKGTNWTYSPNLYWPNNVDTLFSFVGIYPYMSDYSEQFVYNGYDENLSIYYSLGNNASNQVDMLYAVAKNCSVESGEVELNFKHALSKVGLSVAGNVTGTGVDSVVIKEVQLLGVAKSGTMRVSADFSEIDWSIGETTDICISNGSQKLSTTSTRIGDWQYLVPQNIETSPINVSLIYYVYTNSSNVPQTKKSVFELPSNVVAAWEDNHTYNYTLSLNLSEVSFDVVIDVADFENGANVDLNVPNPNETLPETGELNVIYYRSTDGKVIEPYVWEDSIWGGAQIVSNTYENGYGKIVFDDVVTRIGSWFFDANFDRGKKSTLAGIIIPDGVISIGWAAFHDCTNLVDVTLGESIEVISGYAFSGCSSLAHIEIPQSVIRIEQYVFSGCNIRIVVDEDNVIYDSRDNCNAIIETATNTLICGANNSTIPESVTSIGENAFSGCSMLTNVVIPEKVTSIGHGAFWGCLSLLNINIPSSVEYIGTNAFRDVRVLNFESETPCRVDVGFIGPNTIINVPESAINDYANAEGWVAHRHMINGFVEPEINLVNEIVDTIQIVYDAMGYTGTTYSFAIEEIYNAFGVDEESLQKAVEAGRIMFYGEDADGTLHESNSNAYGCWWGESQNVVHWGVDARIFFEGYHLNNFTVGKYPGQVTVGDVYPTSHLITYFSNGETKAIRLKVDVEIVASK